MDEQLYMEFGVAISQLTGRTLSRVHPQLGVKVSPYGEVLLQKSGKHPTHWTFGSKSNGYKVVCIGGRLYYVHRLVAETFLGPIPEGCEIDHISRDKSANMVTNLRIVTHSENQRNTSFHDRVEARGGTHWYEDAKAFNREFQASYRKKYPDKVREYEARCNQAKCKTHRRIRFSDGSQRWVPLAEAEALLAIPLSQRIYKE